MKNTIPFLMLLMATFLLVSCKNEKKEKAALYPEIKKSPEEVALALGKEIFDGKGMCYSCHKPNQKVIGPSVADIAKIYKEKGASITDFLTEKSGPIVEPTQYSVMKTNFAITKNLPEDELKALETYILSFSK
ncbi:c-type cytochrome [Flavobacterium suncheonense]|uniref:Cytochrome C552 n=1 Tax=Flavobacterium suncheonense GH29-5 = DSM 17707 TaxID=1121899 RepID=A0A0A2M5F2_9FLAO|nr:c-type cytochrome [Flavobacterium suncheonense]KGO87504.1 cytochrome C552 [Flavobacterium suncheonense GH29-5 = DSM 17707]